jgi:hypothetical protein
MRIAKSLGVISIAAFLRAGLLQLQGSSPAVAQAAAATLNVAVEPQYDTTHVYVAPKDFDRFVASVAGLQVLGKEADQNLGAVVMELEKHLC